MKAILSIELDEKLNLETRYNWEDALLLPLIWSLDLVKDYLKARLEHKMNLIWKTENNTYNADEKQVSKTDALCHYLELRKQIEDRLQAIWKSDERASFIIDKNFTTKI